MSQTWYFSKSIHLDVCCDVCAPHVCPAGQPQRGEQDSRIAGAADRVGVLARVLDVLRRGGINVQEMDNTLFAGGKAASARIRVVGEPTDALCREMLALEHVLHTSVVPLD